MISAMTGNSPQCYVSARQLMEAVCQMCCGGNTNGISGIINRISIVM